ncbi:Sec-independent protein translocase protein TatCy [Caulifigura coniformis]|uniref:Sec-independent protein translocase protein TatC n=1 Tax=Caulifigura coniformis TaxID=2527983 RepID=A0A517SGK6_9PLAN|nr:twin-arginine translocase subunit TatC [Caulifigura coniformis]QDT55263.1 Sec-independent protein translocase protein TatCy [Caulifigura coniformis]
MATRSKDLFDDSVMTFGEHLEALRTHLWKALLGLGIAMGLCLWKGDIVVRIVQRPLEAALKKYGNETKLLDDLNSDKPMWQALWETLNQDPESINRTPGEKLVPSDSLTVELPAAELHSALATATGKPLDPLPEADQAKPVALTFKSPFFSELRGLISQSEKPVTLKVEEGFMTYLKLSGVAGLLLASPWIFYQVWMFVAAGLYAHERKYVYVFGGMSLALFLLGVVFCYYLVFPFVLRFLISFNTSLGLTLQPRLSEWVTFAIILPLMFGISFQLPLVMLFLERLQIFDTKVYMQNWRFAVLAISFISMILTPADPISMLLMMAPLIGLYFFGVLLCRYASSSAEPAAAT